jgi:cell growth-regulating nucleolar protein
MPSFVCDACQETLKKPKLDMHAQRCRGASFSCIDCYKSFSGTLYRQHFSCITEVEKYEKKKPVAIKVEQPHTVKQVPIPIAPPTPETLPERIAESTVSESIKAVLKTQEHPMRLKAIKKALKSAHGKKAIKKFLETAIQLSFHKDSVKCSIKLD